MNNQQIYVFGKLKPASWLNNTTARGLAAEALKRSKAAAKAKITDIIEVLNKVSLAWANPQYHLRLKAASILPKLTGFGEQTVNEGFEAISAICGKESIIKRLCGELGSLYILDGETEKTELGYSLRALPNGVLLHLTAGNVFVSAVDSLVSGIITKNANILKMSRVDSVFPVLFVESIKEFDPAGIVWPNQALLSWRGGDDSIEEPLFNSKLTIVFWGGAQALKSIKARIGPNAALIENGPRYSFAVIEAKAASKEALPRIAKGLALDLSRWNQQACSSPHVIYVIGDGPQKAYEIMKSLYDEMLILSKTLEIGALSFDEKVEIRKARDIALMSQARQEGKILCPEKFDFTLIYEESPEFKVSCLNRTLFFKTVKGINELRAQISPLAEYLQTVGIRCTPALSAELKEMLLEMGACRLTEIGGMSEGHDGAPHEGSFLLQKLVQWVDDEYLNTPESAIERLLSAISASPYYKSVIKKAGGVSFENFKRLPFLDRETFYKNSPPDSEAILTGPLTDAYAYASGGTTGRAKFSLYSNGEYKFVTNLLADVYKCAGITASDRVANLFIAGNLWTSFNVAGRALENIGCLNLPIGGASDIENTLKYLQIFKANAIVGLPSIIIGLAEEIEKRSLPIKIEKILYGGEHLREQTCTYLKKAVGAVSIRSAGYACVDTGLIGYQCMALKGSVHHVCSSYCYVEIIDTETQTPIEEYGKEGEIVVTNLNRVLMPIVRYKTGDLGCWVDIKKCECGFVGRSFELLGRCDDLMVIGGINLLPVDVEIGLSRLKDAKIFQIVGQKGKTKDLLVIRIESKSPSPAKAVVEALKRGSYKISEALQNGWLDIKIEWLKPNTLPRSTRTGKIKQVVDLRPQRAPNKTPQTGL